MPEKTILSVLSDARDNDGKRYDAEKMQEYARRFQERNINFQNLLKLMVLRNGKRAVLKKLKEVKGLPAGVYCKIANAVSYRSQQLLKRQ